MAWYIAESYDYLVDQAGRRSEGVVGAPIASGRGGSEKIYLHAIELNAADIARLSAREDEHGNKQHDRLALPMNEEWWIAVEGELKWPKLGGHKVVSTCFVGDNGVPKPSPLSPQDAARLVKAGVKVPVE